MREKIDLFELPESQMEMIEKFLPSLGLVSYEELKEVLDYLKSQGIYITKAREIRIVTELLSKLKSNIDMAEQIHEQDIYRQDPRRLSTPLMEVNKKIQYSKQMGIPYKNDKGNYESFLFSEAKWAKATENVSDFNPRTMDFVSQESIVPFEVSDAHENADYKQSLEDEFASDVLGNVRDIPDFEQDLSDINAHTTTVQTLKEELTKEIDSLDTIGFENLEDFYYENTGGRRVA